jgi:hypothetical protein
MADGPSKAQIYQAASRHYFGNALRTTCSTYNLPGDRALPVSS